MIVLGKIYSTCPNTTLLAFILEEIELGKNMLPQMKSHICEIQELYGMTKHHEEHTQQAKSLFIISQGLVNKCLAPVGNSWRSHGL